MYDFVSRAAMDAYEQMNGKIKGPQLTYGLPDIPTKPGWISRLRQATQVIRHSSLGRKSTIQTMSGK